MSTSPFIVSVSREPRIPQCFPRSESQHRPGYFPGAFKIASAVGNFFSAFSCTHAPAPRHGRTPLPTPLQLSGAAFKSSVRFFYGHKVYKVMRSTHQALDSSGDFSMSRHHRRMLLFSSKFARPPCSILDRSKLLQIAPVSLSSAPGDNSASPLAFRSAAPTSPRKAPPPKSTARFR